MSRANRHLIIELLLIIAMIFTGSGTAADSNQTNNETISLFNNSTGSLIIVNPEDSIQDAIHGSSPGDIIEVHGGVHRENINVSKRVAIRGIDEGDGLPVVDAHRNGSAIIVSADGVQIEKLIVENSSDGDAGVKITSNDSIINNIIVRNNEHYGIELIKSNNNDIFGNNLSDNENGIHLASSNNNSLLKNYIIGRGYGSGIELANSENNSLIGNNLSGNSDGIRLSSSGSNRLRMNLMSGNNINFYMDGEHISDFDNDIDDTNIADGRFVNYIKGARDEVIDANSDALLIGCFNCSNVTLQNLNRSDGVDSFIVVSTNGSKFIENYLRIRFYFSNNNNISQNEIIEYENGIQRYSFHDNTFVNGILLSSSNDNSLRENDIVGSNDGSGIELTNSENNNLIGNNLSDNFDGIRLASSNNNSLLENHIVSLGDGSGIELTDSQNNNLTGNNLSDNFNGVRLASSNNNSLLENDIVGSYDGSGIGLTNSNNNSLAGNNLSDSRNGISLASSNNNSLLENDIIGSYEGFGIELTDSQNNNLTGNKVKDSRNSIRLALSNNNSLLKNDILGRGYGSGIALTNSENNSLLGNNLSGNSDGIRLSSSGSNRLRMNLMSGNKNNIYMDGERISDFDNDIDDTNIADSRFVNYIKGARDEVIDASSNALLIGCFNCSNVTLQNLNSSNGVDSFIVVSTNGSKFIENYLGIRFYFSNNNDISQNKIGNYENGILLHSSHANSIISNYLAYNENAIRLESSDNNSILENDIINEGSGSGIILSDSKNNNLTSNNLSKNRKGIRLSMSDNNYLLENNIVSLGDGSGVELANSQNNELISNNLSDNSDGIRLSSSGSNRLRKNLMSENKFNFIMEGERISDFDNDIDATNLINDRPIYYLKNNSNKTIDFTYNAGMIGCFNCTNIKLIGLNITNVGTGIFFIKTNFSDIISNNISHANKGIFLYSSNYNNISFNNITDSAFGIYLDLSDNIIIENNSVSINISKNPIGDTDLYNHNNKFINNSANAELIYEGPELLRDPWGPKTVSVYLQRSLETELMDTGSPSDPSDDPFWSVDSGSFGETPVSGNGKQNGQSRRSSGGDSDGKELKISEPVKKEPTATEERIESIREEYEALEWGQIVFTPPGRMRRGVEEYFVARISPNLTENISEGLGPTEQEEIKVSYEMIAELEGYGDFDISPKGPQKKSLPIAGGYQEWNWKVTPLKEGVHKIKLSAYAIISLDGTEEEEIPIETFEKDILIEVDWIMEARNFIFGGGKWVAALFVTALVQPGELAERWHPQ